MNKTLSILIVAMLILPAISLAQLDRNDDGTYNIGTLDTTSDILNQESQPVDLEAKDGINRIVTLDDDGDSITSSEVEIESFQDDQIISNTTANMVDVSSYFQVANTTKEEAKEAIKEGVMSEVQKALRDLESQNTDEANDKLGDVIEKRTTLFKEIDDYFKTNSFITDPEAVTELNNRINTVFTDIEDTINNDDFRFSRVSINETLIAFRETLKERTKIFEDRSIEVLTDSDGDGLSDFDEVNIYKTDPDSAYTVGGKLNDKEKIMAGINPLSDIGESIQYEDPRLDRDAVEVMNYILLGLEFIPANKSNNGNESLTIRGSAIPNSLVTIYLFSTPIVITTEVDAEGNWEHKLGRYLEDGEHSIYVTTTDSRGRILAKGQPMMISKSAQAAAIGVLVAQPSSTDVDTFFDQYSFLILLVLFLTGVVVTISLIIKTRRELREENLFVPIHPGATPFIPDENSARSAPDLHYGHHESLYPNLDKKDRK